MKGGTKIKRMLRAGVVCVFAVVAAATHAGSVDELLPRPKEVRASADGSLSVEGLPPGGYVLRICSATRCSPVRRCRSRG